MNMWKQGICLKHKPFLMILYWWIHYASVKNPPKVKTQKVSPNVSHVLRCAQWLQLCLTLCDPTDCSPPGS